MVPAVGEAAGWIASVVGALVLLFVVQKLRGSAPAPVTLPRP